MKKAPEFIESCKSINSTIKSLLLPAMQMCTKLSMKPKIGTTQIFV